MVSKCCIFLLFVLFGLSGTDSKLKQLHVIFRHGERSPTETYKNDPYINFTWSGGWGQLTNRGKFEIYSLGLKLRKLYPDFIPKYYFPGDIKMSSSYADRCLMSAEVLLAALLPPKDEQVWNVDLLWQPIPVHYVPRSQDNLIAMKAKCKNYDEQFEQIMKSENIKKINEDNSDLYNYLTKHTGQEIRNVGDVEILYNTLEIELLHNFTLPSWTQNISLEHLKNLAARNLEIFTETDYMKRMKGGVFLKQVISSLGKGEKSPFLHLYSAHDLSLVNILKTLGYKSILKPGFGAFFILEMRNDSTITMTYRDDVERPPEQITIKNCAEPCSLDQFKIALQPFLPIDWEAECNQ